MLVHQRTPVCATMMWSWERPAKRREWKLIVSGLLVYESMACLTSTAWCSSAKCGYLAPPLTPAPNISKWHFSDIAALANVRFAPIPVNYELIKRLCEVLSVND